MTSHFRQPKLLPELYIIYFNKLKVLMARTSLIRLSECDT